MVFRAAIFLMMKYPKAGAVKSRLAQSIGEEAAAHLYRVFIQDTLALIRSVDTPYYIAVYPPDSIQEFGKLLGGTYRFMPQRGAHLGERLHNGFVDMFAKGYDQVIALASDSPDLPSKILKTALSSLKDQEVVIGPALDGGYYLLGFSQKGFISNAFENIPWSTEKVFRETLLRIKSVTNQIHVLPKWTDIDTMSELRFFYEKHRINQTTLETMKYLSSHPGLLEGARK